MEQFLLNLSLTLFQILPESVNQSWVEIALAVLGALGLREIVPWLLNKRKTDVEIEASKKKLEIDDRHQTDFELDKAIDRWNEAMNKAQEFSRQVFDLRSTINERDTEILKAKHEIALVHAEKSHLEKSLSIAGEEINKRDLIIIELRGDAQESNKGGKGDR